MKISAVNRRDFNKLSMSALGGLMAGTVAGCGKKPEEPAAQPAPPAEAGGDTDTETEEDEDGSEGVAQNPLLSEPHVCRGLNTCKGKGATGENACAGQGACATAEAHTCHAENACKGQGGCGETAGQNACKAKGNCAVPLSEEAWTKARSKFEELMAEADKPVGAAPPKS